MYRTPLQIRKSRILNRKSGIEILEDRRLLTINIDLDQTTGPTIEQYGWDIKGGANIRDQSRSDFYHSTGANIFRVPFFPTAHNQDGTIDESDYANQLRDIALVQNSNPDVKIFASLKLRGADTFPAWMETGESCRIFNNNVFKPDVESYTDALVDYVEYFHQNDVKIDSFGLNNEVEACLTPSRYSDVVASLRTKLASSPIPEEYRSFDLVGPDTFRVSTGASYVAALSNPSDVIDIAGIHFYAGSSDRAEDLTNLDAIVGGDMWFTEVHMNPSNANKGQTPEDNFGKMRHGMAMVLEANRQGANTFIWWNPGATPTHFDDEVKLELIGSTLDYTPVLTQNSNGQDNILPYTSDDSAPFFQTFRQDDEITIWVANGWESTMTESFDLGTAYQITGEVQAEYWTSDGADNIANDIDANALLDVELSDDQTGFDIEIPSDSFAEITFSVAPFGTEVPPKVSSVLLNANQDDPADIGGVVQPTSWHSQRSSIVSIAVELTQPVTIGLADITLTNLGLDPMDTPEVIALDEGQLTVSGKNLMISFPNNELPEGAYQLDLSANIDNEHGLGLDGDGDGAAGDPFVFRGSQANGFYKLVADWNGDLGVSVFDFTTFSYWFGHSTDVAPTYVDLSGDEGVSVFDFTGFADNFGKGVNFPPAFAGVAMGTRSFDGLANHIEPIQTTAFDSDRNDRVIHDRVIHDRAIREVLHEWNIVESKLLEREAIALIDWEDILPPPSNPAGGDGSHLFSI